MNETLLSQLKLLKLSDSEPNFSELARMYDVDRRTVKKYYDGYEGKPKHHSKSSKLDQYQELIKQKLLIRGTTVRSVYEFIITETDPDIGTYSNFIKYVKKRNLVPSKTQKGHPRFETTPGYQAQVDWKEDISIPNKYGELFTFQVFDYKLGYSRYCHFTYKLSKTRQDVFNCLINCFLATGGVPKEILFDNMASVVDLKDNHRQVNSRMKTFADDFGFKIRLCKPRHPFTKGKVETINKFLDWLRPYEGEFETEEELIAILEKINKKVNTQICQATNVSPILLFQKEKEYLQSLPHRNIIESYRSYNRQTIVPKDSLITYKSNRYSVPSAYIGKTVNIEIKSDKLYIYYSTELVAVHTISDKKMNYNKEHYTTLLAYSIANPDLVNELAEENLKRMDDFL